MKKEIHNNNLYSKYLTGELDKIQQDQVDQQFSNFPEDKYSVQKIGSAWNSWSKKEPQRKYNPDQALINVMNRISHIEQQTSSPILSISRWIKYAAIIVAFAGTGLLLYNLLNSSLDNPDYYAETTNYTKKVILPDNSIVYLNHNSMISYTGEPDKRFAYLTGEGFFEISPDKQRPFSIYAGKSITKVVGTSFNIKAYPDSASVQIVVNSGNVIFSDTDNKMRESLVEGEKAILQSESKKSITIRKMLNPDINYRSWQTGQLSFNNTDLLTVFLKLEEVYHIPIEIEDPGLADLKLTANFNDTDVKTIFSVIEATFNIQIDSTINDSWVARF